MRTKFQIIALISLLAATFLFAGPAWAHPGSPHIHEGPALMQDHTTHSPFQMDSQHLEAKNKGQSLHCILNGHSPDQPCPHMKPLETEDRKTIRLSTECGGHASPDGSSVVKTDGSYYAVTPSQSDAVCSGQELFPAIHPMISRSLPETAPPPRRVPLSY